MNYLLFAVLCLIERDSLIYIFHSVTQHAIDEPSEFGGHGLGCHRRPQSSPQSAKLRSRKVVAAILKTVAARLLVGMRPLPMIFPPLILLSGDSFRQETKWFSVFHLLMSRPTSLMTVIAAVTSMPSIWVRSVPVMRNNSFRKLNCGFPFFLLRRHLRVSSGKVAPWVRSSSRARYWASC